MRRQRNKRLLRFFSWLALFTALLTSCGSSGGASESNTGISSAAPSVGPNENAGQEPADTPAPSADTLTVRFGDGGDPFTLYMKDNETADDIVRCVGTADWRLPIYHFDDYDGWESFQYYDIPSRYEITPAPEAVTSEKAGEVYFSEPNRIVLFYHDAEISGDYTLVGTFDATDEFVAAVEENPVLEGWGNKIVNISISQGE